MEALILTLLALLAMTLIEAGYWIVLAMTRWTPVIGAGVLGGLVAQSFGFDRLEALAIGVLICLVLRHALRRRAYGGDIDP